MTQPAEVATALGLIAAYEALSSEIERRLAEAVASDDPKVFRALDTYVKTATLALDDSVPAWASQELADTYAAAGQQVDAGWEDHQFEIAAVVSALLAATASVRQTSRRLAHASPAQRDQMLYPAGYKPDLPGPRVALTRNSIGVVYSNGARHSLGEYAAMVIRTNVQDTWNRGVLAASRFAGMSYVRVHDGRSCGWPFHFDMPRADGLIRTTEEADNYRLAHPNCMRSFTPISREVARANAATGEDVTLTYGDQRLSSNLAARSARLAARNAKLAV